MKNQILPDGVHQNMIDFTLDAFRCEDIPVSILCANKKLMFKNFFDQREARTLAISATVGLFSIAVVSFMSAFVYLTMYEENITRTQMIFWGFTIIFPIAIDLAIWTIIGPVKKLDEATLVFCKNYFDFISEISFELYHGCSENEIRSARKFIAMYDNKKITTVMDKRLTSAAMVVIQEERESTPVDNESKFARDKLTEIYGLYKSIYPDYSKSWDHYFKAAYFELGIIPPHKLVEKWGLTDKDIEKIRKKAEEKRMGEESTDQSQTVSV